MSHIRKAHPRMVTRCKGERLSTCAEFTYKVKATYGKLMTKEVKYTCKLCHRNLSHNRPAIKSHLSGVHGFALVTYYEKFHGRITENSDIKIEIEVENETK